ncbi:MAG: hypothetical protein WDN06_19800 [Asticcacaulis sp.]
MMKLEQTLRCWSVQAAAVGGSLTAFLAALQDQGVHVPPLATAATALLTAVAVAVTRALPQGDIH